MHYDTIIIGTGCAGYNAADWLYELGHRNIAIVTEGVNMGTSRNTGSDKQTYYKLSLAGSDGDSVGEMAKTLYSGGGVNGETALVEAACSVKSFMKLVNLGVPFPTNAYGEYVGYKTDHDPRQRATSCGPLTSKLMTEALERAVKEKNIPVLDGLQAVKLLTENNRIVGIAALSLDSFTYHTISCSNIILATGGPAGVYYDSVYPESQTGGTGLAIDAGARLVNMSEWQYGLASTKFRWNVSGTYQQVLPRYIAVDKQGNERELLNDYYSDPNEALSMVFLKGYQWPFDVKKLDGSSRIDMLIHKEINEKGNRVFMDFRSNPAGLDFEKLSEEAYTYLKKSGAAFGKPIERLALMNCKAIELYRQNGIDLYTEPLEVAVCAQHANGGVLVDENWQTSIEGLYAAGEAAGTFGVYRAGGSALNSTQVGSMRAAEHIAYKKKNEHETHRVPPYIPPAVRFEEQSNLIYKRIEMQKRFSRYAAFMRDTGEMKRMLHELIHERECFFEEHKLKHEYELPFLHKSYDILLTQISTLSAMLKSAEMVGSRGAALVDGKAPVPGEYDGQRVVTEGDVSLFEAVTPIPQADDWFETVWNDYNKRIIRN